jgi:Mg-chelatase subunit ChlD
MGLIKRDKKPGGALGKLRGQKAIQKAIDDGDTVAVGKQESLVIAIDASASMEESASGAPMDFYRTPNLRGSKWEAAVQAANLLANRSMMSNVGLVAFDSEVPSGWRCKVGSSSHTILGFLERMRPRGGTCFTAGLAASLDLLDDVDRLPVQRIILLSDGFDGGHSGISSWHTVCERLRARKVIVDTVGFGLADEVRLREIADMTGGVYKHAKDAEELVKQFKLLEASVRGLLASG